MKWHSILLSLVILFSACTSTRKIKSEIIDLKSESPIYLSKVPLFDSAIFFEAKENVITLPPFETELQLSTKTGEELKNSTESVIIHINFFGVPRNSVSHPYIKSGKLYLSGTYYVQIIDHGDSYFSSLNIPKELFELLKFKDYNVSMKIYRQKKSSHKKILIYNFTDKISKLAWKRVVISYK